jgi:imidazolonepropionase-like amidohydrolase
MLLPLVLPALLVALAGDSVVYPVLNHGRVAGSMVVRHEGDTVTVRYVFTDRNRGARLQTRYVIRDGRPVYIETRPVLADDRIGDATSRLEIVGGSVRRWTPKDSSSKSLEPDTYDGRMATPFDDLAIVRFLQHQPQHSGKLADPKVNIRLEVVREVTVPTSHGKERVRLVAIHLDPGETPELVWLDSHDELFSTNVGWFMTIKPGAEPALPTLRKIETDYHDRRAEALNTRLVKPTSGVIAVTNGDLFDSERGIVRPKTTVVIRGERIVAVGPADSVAIPSGATVINAAGKTVMPGMWDMHGHMDLVSETSGSLMQLGRGITTVRDLASDVDFATSQRDRGEAGRIAAPHSVLAGFMEGPEKWAGPTATIVSTEAEARQWVARYDSLGYKQIKVYNLVHPDLIPTIAKEAHARGMRLSGHIPRGLSVPAAVQLGFDEINHAAFLFSTFYQDSLYVPTMRAYSAVATAVAPNIDVDGPGMTQLVSLLAQHKTVIDGTFAVWVTSAGTGIGQAVGAGVSTDVQKADANYMRLLKKLYDAGVTLVPGTDAFGSTTYNTELELYERVGIPAPVVLQIATITSARVMKDDRDYGSIAPGKVADVIVIDGKPAEHVADLRKVERVIRAGRLYDPRELRKASGLDRE